MENNAQLFELMTKMYAEMQDGFNKIDVELKETKVELQEIKSELQETKNDLSNFREETNIRFDTLENKIDDNDAKNADRHVTIIGDINNLTASLSKLEIVTADNWSDIARLKARKRKTR